VGRLVLSLSRLGREMAGLPELKEDVSMKEVEEAPAPERVAAPVEKAPAQQAGKKGKKKGRK